MARKQQQHKLRIIPIGGLDEIGKNMTVVEYGDNIMLIDCGMDGCEVIGAFLAHQLARTDLRGLNSKKEISVITPEFNANGQFIFRDNMQPMVWGKKVLLLIASATTGKTINRSLECIQYYGGEVVGISAIFSAIDEMKDIEIKSLFKAEDLPDYRTYPFHECPDCQQNIKIDAIVNSFGYSKINM